MSTFTLVEREKLGPNAYRVNAILGTAAVDGEDNADTAFARLMSEIQLFPQRYDPCAGTHTLVLLAKEGKRNG